MAPLREIEMLLSVLTSTANQPQSGLHQSGSQKIDRFLSSNKHSDALSLDALILTAIDIQIGLARQGINTEATRPQPAAM